MSTDTSNLLFIMFVFKTRAHITHTYFVQTVHQIGHERVSVSESVCLYLNVCGAVGIDHPSKHPWNVE